MARLAVFVDRAVNDPEWKGAVVWNIILGLAESQHEVLALTPLDPAVVPVSHPRLIVARPARSFSLLTIHHWLQALFQFQPEIVHTFGLKRPSSLSAWPVLAQTVMAFPRVQRYSTVFSVEDYAPFSAVTAPFDAAEFAIGSASTEIEMRDSPSAPQISSPYIVIPAPVCEWQRPTVDLLLLGDYLEHNPEVEAHVVGGWGEGCGLLERRRGWELLGPLSARVQMVGDLNFPDFVGLARRSRGVWLRALRANSWRTYVSSHVAEALSLPMLGVAPQLNTGSSANFLSRLYSS